MQEQRTIHVCVSTFIEWQSSWISFSWALKSVLAAKVQPNNSQLRCEKPCSKLWLHICEAYNCGATKLKQCLCWCDTFMRQMIVGWQNWGSVSGFRKIERADLRQFCSTRWQLQMLRRRPEGEMCQNLEPQLLWCSGASSTVATLLHVVSCSCEKTIRNHSFSKFFNNQKPQLLH